MKIAGLEEVGGMERKEIRAWQRLQALIPERTSEEFNCCYKFNSKPLYIFKLWKDTI